MRLLLTKSYNTVLIIIIVPLMLSPLCLLLLVRLGVSTVNLCAFYFDRLMGKLISCSFRSSTSTINLHFLRAVFSSKFKSKVSHILAKAAALRIMLNIDGAPI